MFYHILKILHIISAALILMSVITTIKLWLTSASLQKIQAQTWMLFIPATIFQLVSGFTMISFIQDELSDFWMIASMGGFMVFIISWFSFLYLVFTSSPNTGNRFTKLLQIIFIIVTSVSLLFMIFLMTDKTL